jgi:molybdate/tungstate transport system permease protein
MNAAGDDRGRLGSSAISKSAGSDAARALVRPFLIVGLLLVAYLIVPIARLAIQRPSAVLGAIWDPGVRGALALTFITAAAAVAIGAIFCIPLGYALARSRRVGLARVLTAASDLPLVLPHPVAGIALLLLFARHQAGGEILRWMHVHFADTAVGIVGAMLFVSAPYLLHTCRDGMAAVDTRYEAVARTLGCGPFETFRRVTWPLARRHVVSGAILMFARAVSEFGSLVVVAYNPRVISVLIYDRFNTLGLDAVAPIAAILVLFGFGIVLAVGALEYREAA